MAKRIGFADLVSGVIVRKLGVMPIAIMDAETFAKRVVCIRSADLLVLGIDSFQRLLLNPSKANLHRHRNRSILICDECLMLSKFCSTFQRNMLHW